MSQSARRLRIFLFGALAVILFFAVQKRSYQNRIAAPANVVHVSPTPESLIRPVEPQINRFFSHKTGQPPAPGAKPPSEDRVEAGAQSQDQDSSITTVGASSHDGKVEAELNNEVADVEPESTHQQPEAKAEAAPDHLPEEAPREDSSTSGDSFDDGSRDDITKSATLSDDTVEDDSTVDEDSSPKAAEPSAIPPMEEKSSDPTVTIVMGRMSNESERVEWVHEKLENITDAEIYIVDDANTTLPHLSRNHGREAAVYLTYIINYYDKLNDITFFWHNDEIVWHNNLLLSWDSVLTINRMDRQNILREGYVPSRCDNWPGCPDWVKFNPSKAEHRLDPHKLGEMFSERLFDRVFPEAKGEFPPYFAGTCCSQFAVTRETIRRRPVESYQRMLDWILEYQYDDRSGMVLEYTWPYIFLGRGSLCPTMPDCYCRTYNICLEDKKEIESLEHWNALRTRREEVKWQVTLAEDAMRAKQRELKAEGATQERIESVNSTFAPEVDRLKHELEKLVNTTWQSREDIIHYYGLGVPPVGW